MGVAAMGAFDGVNTTVGGLKNIAVINGSVRNWGRMGVNLGTLSAVNCRVEGVLASSNVSIGISVGVGSTVWNCSASENGGSGINAGTGSTIIDCTTKINTLDGIVCTNTCVIRGNICSSNGFNGAGADIHAIGNINRIEGNNCTGGDRGIDMDVSGKVIIKNTCSSNTINWVIAANNVCGRILDRAAPASAAISGNSASSSLGSTDPNANFTY